MTSTVENALEIRNLSKEFRDFKLNAISFTLPSRCIMGLIGENGAGKSTTIKLILDIISKDSGTVTILGRDNTEDYCLRLQSVQFPGIFQCWLLKTDSLADRQCCSADSADFIEAAKKSPRFMLICNII